MPSPPHTSRRKRIFALIVGVIFMITLIALMAQPRAVSDADRATLRAPLTQA